MFEYLSMADNYSQRKVARDEFDWGMISTAQVNDGDKPFETAVQHSAYGDGKMVIVEAYDSREEAATGHAKWVETMTTNPPPSLSECGNSGVAQFALAMGADLTKPRNESPVG